MTQKPDNPQAIVRWLLNILLRVKSKRCNHEWLSFMHQITFEKYPTKQCWKCGKEATHD